MQGRRLPARQLPQAHKKKPATLAFPKPTGSLRAGAKINIVFTAPGRITGWDTITVRGRNRRIVIREGCKFSGAKKQKRCP